MEKSISQIIYTTIYAKIVYLVSLLVRLVLHTQCTIFVCYVIWQWVWCRCVGARTFPHARRLPWYRIWFLVRRSTSFIFHSLFVFSPNLCKMPVQLNHLYVFVYVLLQKITSFFSALAQHRCWHKQLAKFSARYLCCCDCNEARPIFYVQHNIWYSPNSTQMQFKWNERIM